MKIIKRNGSEAVFDITKIIAAITKANHVVQEEQRLTQAQILAIADKVQQICAGRSHAMGVEDTRLGYTWRDYVPVEGTPGRIAVMLQPEMLSAVREQMEKNPGTKTKIKKALLELAGMHGVSENPVLLFYTLR